MPNQNSTGLAKEGILEMLCSADISDLSAYYAGRGAVVRARKLEFLDTELSKEEELQAQSRTRDSRAKTLMSHLH